MNNATLTHTNGSASSAAKNWLSQTVQQAFSVFNWEDNPPEIQELKLTALQGSDAPLSLTLSVRQFFGAIAWEGQAIAATPSADDGGLLDSISPQNDFTLEDFSDLF